MTSTAETDQPTGTAADEIFNSPFDTQQIVRYAVTVAHKHVTSEGTEDAASRYYAGIEDDEARRSEAADALAAMGWDRRALAWALS